MCALLQQPSQPLQIYEPQAEGLRKVEGHLPNEEGAKLIASSLVPGRKAWLQAVEDKENVDPASGLTVTIRRRSRRSTLLQAQAGSSGNEGVSEAEAGRCLRPPLKDITPEYPDAVVCSSEPCFPYCAVMTKHCPRQSDAK